MNKEKRGGQNYQDSPHKEGGYGNTAYNKPSGQNISHAINEMNQDSEEQIKGRENQQGQNNSGSGQEGNNSKNNSSL